MSGLRAAVYIAPPLKIESQLGSGSGGGYWSPIASTLIYSATEAVLVDTPITISQNEKLVEWIEKIAPGRKLTYIYITHGHGDHFFGGPVIQKRFPEAKVIATKDTAAHMQQQMDPATYQSLWAARFGDEIHPQPDVLAEALPESNEFFLQDKYKFQAIDVGHADTYDSTFLWVPDLRLAVAGDVVYGQVHQMLLEANTKEKREQWIAAIEKLETYEPLYVVPGHVQEGEIMGTWHLANTKQYLIDFGKTVEEEGAKTEAEIVKSMTAKYPDRFNVGALYLGAMGFVAAAKQAAA